MAASFTAENVKEQARIGAKKLGTHKIRTFYLHMPDRSVSFEETHKAVDDLYKEGLL